MKIFRFTAILAIFTICMMTAESQTKSSSDPYRIKFTKETLANGLQVIYYVDKTAPSVSTIMHYNVGSMNEEPEKTGYAHFFEHLMFESTENIKRGKMDEFTQEAGGYLNAHTSFEETVYFFTLPANQIKLALWIESQRMRGLKVDTIGVETQRGVILEEMNMRRANQPYAEYDELLPKILFDSWSVLGSASHIQTATISDFRHFYDKFYRPNNATLVIAGDFEIGQAKNYVNKYFSDFEFTALPKAEKFELPAIKENFRKEFEDKIAELPAVFIMFRGPSMLDSNFYALDILGDILVNGISSRLYQKLVEGQIASQVSVDFNPMKEVSGFTIYAVAALGKDISESEKIILNEINDIIEKGITDAELQKIKNKNEAAFVKQKRSVYGIAAALARYNTYYGNPELINTFMDKYNKVTKEDVQRVAKQYLGTNRKATLVFQPKSK